MWVHHQLELGAFPGPLDPGGLSAIARHWVSGTPRRSAREQIAGWIGLPPRRSSAVTIPWQSIDDCTATFERNHAGLHVRWAGGRRARLCARIETRCESANEPFGGLVKRGKGSLRATRAGAPNRSMGPYRRHRIDEHASEIEDDRSDSVAFGHGL